MIYLDSEQERMTALKVKISDPVLFDANILMNFKGNLKVLFSFFDDIIIHKEVRDEVVEEALKNELDSLSGLFNIKYVVDNIPTDPIGTTLFNQCDEELKNSFNISVLQDLGEYKTLLYAKFNNVAVLSSQDTTVWRFLTKSTYFKGLDCFSVQDIAYLMYLNASCKNDRHLAKKLYERFSRREHPFSNYKQYMEKKLNKLPGYIVYETLRIEHFLLLVASYAECYQDDMSFDDIEREISLCALSHPETCVSCLLSRSDKNKLEFLSRTCSRGHNLNDGNCVIERDEFCCKVRSRENKMGMTNSTANQV